MGARAGLRDEVTSALDALTKKRNVPPGVLFDAAIIATGTAADTKIIAALQPLTRAQDKRGLAATYHMARAHERTGNEDEARRLYQQAITRSERFGIRYYSMWSELGLVRIDGKAPTPADDHTATTNVEPTEPKPSLEKTCRPSRADRQRLPRRLPWFGRAQDLLLGGDSDAATAELFEAYVAWKRAKGRPVTRAGLESVAKGKDLNRTPLGQGVRNARLTLEASHLATLASIASAMGDHGTAVGFGGYELAGDRPRAYEWLATPAANKFGLDPNLLLAVMRVESVYQKRIVSYAGAIGLTQIMPRTGQLIAHAVGHRDFTSADLLDPKTNLHFAAWYLNSLIRRFDGHLPLAIAAYNGGPHNVRRWMQDHGENIPLRCTVGTHPILADSPLRETGIGALRSVSKTAGSSDATLVYLFAYPDGRSSLVLEATGQQQLAFGLRCRKNGRMTYKVLIIGSGPAAHTAAIYAARRGA